MYPHQRNPLRALLYAAPVSLLFYLLSAVVIIKSC